MKLVSFEKTVRVNTGTVDLYGDLSVPENARGLVLFAHGSGSSRHSSRNKFVARVLNEAGLGTMLLDLLTYKEEEIDNITRQFRFDIARLSNRLAGTVQWLQQYEATRDLKTGIFGASTGGAAALITAGKIPDLIGAVVSRGGRPDLAGESLPLVKAPTLLIVGGQDFQVIQLNNEALDILKCEKRLLIVPGATHLFEEPGKLEIVAEQAKDWFIKFLG
jgi:putative phosphoribosyl transferase